MSREIYQVHIPKQEGHGIVRVLRLDVTSNKDTDAVILGAIENPEYRPAKILWAAGSFAKAAANQKVSVGVAKDATTKGDNLFTDIDASSQAQEKTYHATAVATLNEKGHAADSFITVHQGDEKEDAIKTGVTVLLSYDY